MAGATPDPGVTAQGVVEARGVSHAYGSRIALQSVDITLAPGKLVGVIGPDGVGKSTLLSLIAGARRLQAGDLRVFGRDLRRARERPFVLQRLGFMPQGLGANLYADLSVRENLDFFGRLFEVPRRALRARSQALLTATGIEAAADRRVRQLSGGMKQKVALCCALVHEPDLLILDEPTTGVDPLSRQAFWQLVAELRARRTQLGVLVATAYMPEAEEFDELVLLQAGSVLESATPPALRARAGGGTLEEAYATLLGAPGRTIAEREPLPDAPPEIAIRARGLTRHFGALAAVDDVSFDVSCGEIFGFIGPNGSGKTTTLKMVTGILPPSAGEARLFGHPVDAASPDVRRQVGYMPQSFSLPGELTPRESLVLYGRLFDLAAGAIDRRVRELAEVLDFAASLDVRAEELPLGVRQRLGLAVALLHRPRLLVLDEPTSGVDPVARERFWRFLKQLTRDERATLCVSTHYLAEANRCGRVALMNQGRLLACAAPDEIAARWGDGDLERAFVGLIREDERGRGAVGASP